jgi:hypothetical protein
LRELAEELQEKVKEKETEATNLNEKLISLTEAVSLKDESESEMLKSLND